MDSDLKKRFSAIAVFAIRVDRTAYRHTRLWGTRSAWGHRSGDHSPCGWDTVIGWRPVGWLNGHRGVEAWAIGCEMAHSPVVALPLLDASEHSASDERGRN
jgi:hypothetical protein